MSKTIPCTIPIREGFEEVFKEQFSLIYNYIYYHIGNAMDTEDLTADVFVRAYKYWESYSPGKGSRGAWLGGIAKNMVKTYFKERSKKPQIIGLSELICADSDTEGEYLYKEELHQMFEIINTLPERQREILTMKYLLHLTNRDIAKIMGMSESNVGVTLHRTIKTIQNNYKTK